jgi:hypothetical protein
MSAYLLWNVPAWNKKGAKLGNALDEFIENGNIFEERENLLRSLGIELKLLLDTEEEPSLTHHVMHEVLGERIIEIKDPKIPLYDDNGNEVSKDAYAKTLQWPRDSFYFLDDTIYIYPGKEKLVEQILTQLDVKPKKTISSVIGEGGKHIDSRNIHIYAGINLDPDSNWENEWNRLLTEGKHLTLPLLVVNEERARTEMERVLAQRMHNSHLDTESNILTRDEQGILMSSKEFYTLNREYIRRISKHYGFRIKIVDDDERGAVNFVELPGGQVIMPDRYPKTIRYLESILGSDYVFPIRTFPGEIQEDGGFRCRTNLIPII